MELAQYVNNIGKQMNNHTKMNVDIDFSSIMNLVLLVHLQELYDKLAHDILNATDFPYTEDDLQKIGVYINCLKKENNFYSKEISENCILTEVEEHIIQE